MLIASETCGISNTMRVYEVDADKTKPVVSSRRVIASVTSLLQLAPLKPMDLIARTIVQPDTVLVTQAASLILGNV